MTMKRYSISPKSPGLEPCHQMLMSYLRHVLGQRSSRAVVTLELSVNTYETLKMIPETGILSMLGENLSNDIHHLNTSVIFIYLSTQI